MKTLKLLFICMLMLPIATYAQKGQKKTPAPETKPQEARLGIQRIGGRAGRPAGPGRNWTRQNSGQTTPSHRALFARNESPSHTGACASATMLRARDSSLAVHRSIWDLQYHRWTFDIPYSIFPTLAVRQIESARRLLVFWRILPRPARRARKETV